MTEVNSLGFVRTRLDERLAALVADMKSIFGADLDLGPDTIDGQALGIFAEAISNLDQLAEEIYHNPNPQMAVGVALRRLVQLNAITHKAGSYSTVMLRCTGTDGTIIPANSLAKSPSTGTTFATIAQATIPGAGFIDIPAQATVKGKLAAAIGSITKIDTPVFGWQSVTNLAIAVEGTDEETDEQLRARRRISTSTAGVSVLDSLIGALSNLSGVIQAVVLENDTDVTDGNGTPPHAIYAIVNGGADLDIATAIWQKKTLGSTMRGTVTVDVLDAIGNAHTIRFSRPIAVPIYIIVNVSQRSGWPTDGDQQIKDALVDWITLNQSIGEELIFSRLYDPINSVNGHSVTSLFIGIAPAPSGTANITIAIDQIVTLVDANITVNVT